MTGSLSSLLAGGELLLSAFASHTLKKYLRLRPNLVVAPCTAPELRGPQQ